MQSLTDNLKLRAAEADKQQHLFYSFLIVVFLFLPLGLTGAMVASLLIGVAKEVWDHFYGSGFCWYDMTANALGIVLAFAIMCVLM